MDGLYALKPWFARTVDPLRRWLVTHEVPPNAISAAGVGFGAGAGVCVATMPAGPVAGVVVGALVIARLACANVDGGVARATGRSSPAGMMANEVGDRLADVAALAGVVVLAPPALAVTAILAAFLPSWVSLAGAAAGAPRLQGGPLGKTERCLLLIVIAATGWAVPVLMLLIAGSVVTAGMRWARLRSRLRGA
jgi:CDP-diacylglycerol--glycerol-3-phosphate 3-phosphatidyltransferase